MIAPTTTADVSTTLRSRRFSLMSLFASEPLFAATALCLSFFLLVTIPAMFLDARLFQGENVWIKPITFQVAIIVYLLTLAFFARWLPPGFTGRRSYRLYAQVAVFTMIAELVWIGGAAVFGIASHFNISSPLMGSLYSLMGLFAVILTSVSLVYGIAIWRNGQSSLDPALRLSIALGLCLTFVLTVPVASTLAGSLNHFVGTPLTGATVPIMGWSREVGDLRVAHFFATHAMHFVPVIGLVIISVLKLLKSPKPPTAQVFVWLTSLAFVGFVVFTFLQALGGQPLVPLP